MADPKVAVVTTSGCKFCKRAKESLKEYSISYMEVEAQGDVKLLTTFREMSGRRTVPQIFVEGKCFGGSDELVAALQDGSFQKLVASATLPPLTDSLQAAVDEAASRRAAVEQAAAASAGPSSNKAELNEVVARMAGSEGIPRKAHTSRFLFKTTHHPPSFTAQAASEWLLSTSPPNTFASPQDTYALLARLQSANLIFDTAHNPGGPDPLTPSPITSSQQFALTSEALKPHYGKPLNTHYAWFGPARPATQVAAELRALILELYDTYLSEDGKAVSYRRMGQDPLWQRFVDSTAELQKVDLAPLNREELMSLFINLYNVVIIHATVAHGAPATTLDRAKFFTTGAKYMVAGQDYSADDMEHGVLRANQAAPLSFLRKHQFSSSDPRSKKVVSPMDPRIHFALVCGAKSCPPIKVYTPESLEEGLQGAAEAFCASEVTLEPEERTATLSKILQWYGQDFGDGEQQVVKAIVKYLEATQKAQLEQMLAAGPVKVVFKPYDWSLNSDEQ